METLAVIGVGLIGGSIALAARQTGAAKRVIGVGRNADRLEQARLAGVIDVGVKSLTDIADADFVVVCTPVDRIVADVLAATAVVRPAAILTDAGSVKGTICRQLEQQGVSNFVGSHPLAGSEKGGFEHARADLFQNRLCVVTPVESSIADHVATIEQFWRQLGMRTERLTPERHDQILALTSHLPHLTASALAALIDDTALPFASSGFRDTTRVAGGDAQLWAAILSQNAAAMQRALTQLTQRLDRFSEVLAHGDTMQLMHLLVEGQLRREAFERRDEGPGRGGEGPETRD
ncbi:MAG: prephenate dehydrogenase [Planctomycetaceae bacterium]|nr:prephenate dehydrogenase [Planctomycetaceae bacterium]